MSQALSNQVAKLQAEVAALRAEIGLMREQMKSFARKRGPQKREQHNATH
jgi:uncharacterized coiled-coil protein SlyX